MASARRKNFRTGAEILEEIFADEHSDDSEDDDLLTASSAINMAYSSIIAVYWFTVCILHYAVEKNDIHFV